MLYFLISSRSLIQDKNFRIMNDGAHTPIKGEISRLINKFYLYKKIKAI